MIKSTLGALVVTGVATLMLAGSAEARGFGGRGHHGGGHHFGGFHHFHGHSHGWHHRRIGYFGGYGYGHDWCGQRYFDAFRGRWFCR
ncbi:hypothetical protein [Methylobacterium oryzisoli]|uniref:hypothetical protein n=1 Tax=Methylobacterium oryzisoli TaxID=3385502 RepID=UPI0038922214